MTVGGDDQMEEVAGVWRSPSYNDDDDDDRYGVFIIVWGGFSSYVGFGMLC